MPIEEGKSTMRRYLTVILLFALLVQFVPFPAQATKEGTSAGSIVLTEDGELRQKIAYLYQASLEYAEKDSFDGYCAFYVNTQLYLLKINRKYVAGNGNEEFDNYRYLERSNGGYNITAYPASKYTLKSALNTICDNGQKQVFNILVGFQRGVSNAGRKYGHTCFIHAIIDGTIYFSDSQKVTIDGVDYPEGTPLTATVDQFSEFYKPWTLDGLIHFTYPEDGHVCDKSVAVFQSDDHPHISYYQCGQCGQIWKDWENPAYKDECQGCNCPGTPTLQLPRQTYLEGETLEFTWEETSLTTSYQLILEIADESGQYQSCATYDTNATALTIPAVIGSCRAKVRGLNENGHMPDGTKPAYTDSQWLYFIVEEPWDCAVRGHEHEVKERKEPTCTQKGFARYACLHCGAEETEPLHPTGHRFDNGTIMATPKGEQNGIILYRCANCEEKRIEALPSQSGIPFEDLSINDFFYVGAVWAYNSGITTGATETDFFPYTSATRAQVVTFLWRAAGSPEPTVLPEDQPFVDVDWEEYYGKALLWAVESGITSGMSAHHFGPEHKVTRAQFVTFLYRVAGQPETGCGIDFSDTGRGEYYDDAVAWAVRNSITNGMSSTKFRPDDICTRGQIVTFLYRYYNWM